MPDSRLDEFLNDIERNIRKMIFSYMILGRFPADWSFESYNDYLERHGYHLSCMLFCFSSAVTEDVQRKQLNTELTEKFPQLCVKVYGDFIVCLAFEDSSSPKCFSEDIATQISSFLNGAKVQTFTDGRINNLWELVSSYQRLCSLAEASMVQFDRAAHILRLYTLEEALLDSIMVCEFDNIKLALEEIAELIDRTNNHDWVCDLSYFCFLWRHIDRVVYQKTGLRATISEKLTMDHDLHTASDLSDGIAILQSFIFKYIDSVGLYNRLDNSGSYHRIINRAKEFVIENCAEDLSLERVSREVGLSSFYLSKLFKKEEGINYKDFVIKVRMEKAHSLICNEAYTVSEAARAVGYNNLNYFGKAFKTYFGITARDLKLGKEKRVR